MTRSAALTRSSSPSQAGPSGSFLERETPGERQRTVAATLPPPNGLLAEATSNSRVVSTPRQPLASVYYLTKAGTQTKPQSHRSGLLLPPETDLYLGQFLAGTVGARLYPTWAEARTLRDRALRRATSIMYSINIAIALLILLGATSVTLAGILHNKADVEIPDAVLAGCSTIVASYLAAMRGSSEPEYSYLRQHSLSSFIRKLEAFLLDHGTESGNGHNKAVETFREEFDRLLIPPRWSARMVDFTFDREKKKINDDSEEIAIKQTGDRNGSVTSQQGHGQQGPARYGMI